MAPCWNGHREVRVRNIGAKHSHENGIMYTNIRIHGMDGGLGDGLPMVIAGLVSRVCL